MALRFLLLALVATTAVGLKKGIYGDSADARILERIDEIVEQGKISSFEGLKLKSGFVGDVTQEMADSVFKGEKDAKEVFGKMLGWVKPEEVKPEALVETEAKTEEKPVVHGVSAEENPGLLSTKNFEKAKEAIRLSKDVLMGAKPLPPNSGGISFKQEQENKAPRKTMKIATGMNSVGNFETRDLQEYQKEMTEEAIKESKEQQAKK